MRAKILASNPIELPIAGTKVCAGFPSPADDYLEDPIDLYRLLVPRKACTYLWRVEGHSMIDVGIYNGDILVVDRSVSPRPGHVVIAIVDGEKSIKLLKHGMRLSFANKTMTHFTLPEEAEVTIWGVVTWNLHRHLP